MSEATNSEGSIHQASSIDVEASTEHRGLRKTRVGTVVSSKMSKTAVVETITRVPHPKFRKIVKQSKRFYVHDEANMAQVGDLVRIMETRPLSRLKRWRLLEVLKH